MKKSLVIGAVFLLGMLTGLALPQFNIWPYSACHGLGGAIHIAEFHGGGEHRTNCVIPWTDKRGRQVSS